MENFGSLFVLFAPILALYLTVKIVIILKRDFENFPFKKDWWINIELQNGDSQSGLFKSRSQYGDIVIQCDGKKIWINGEGILKVTE